jgi:plastocyanin domain-containing protein
MMKIAALLIPFAFATACKKDDSAPKPTTTSSTKSADSARFDIKVTENGFEPEETAVPAGKPVTLVFERKTEQTCAKQLVLTMDDGKKIEKDLPMNTPVEIAATFPKTGKVGYACGMDMVKGTIVVQ